MVGECRGEGEAGLGSDIECDGGCSDRRWATDQCRTQMPFRLADPPPSVFSLPNHFYDHPDHPRTPSASSFSLFLGDLSPFPDVFYRPRLASAFSFVGCLGLISINGLDLAEDLAILEEQFDQFQVKLPSDH